MLIVHNAKIQLFIYFTHSISYRATINADSLYSEAKKTTDKTEKLKLLITILKNSTFDLNYGHLLPEIDFLSDSLNLEWAQAMNHFLQAGNLVFTQKDSSAQHFLKALHIFETRKDTSGIINCYINLYHIHFNAEGIEEDVSKDIAQKYYDRFITLAEASTKEFDKIMLLWAKIMFNRYHDNVTDISKIMSYYDEGIAIIEKNKNFESKRMNLMNALMAEMYRLGAAKELLSVAHEELKVNITKKTKNLDSYIYNVGYLSYATGDYYNAEKYFIRLLDSIQSKNSNWHHLYQSACDVLGEIYQSKGDYKSALKFYQLKDSVAQATNNAERIQGILKFEANLEFLERKLKTAAIAKQKRLLEVVVFSLIGLLLILGLITAFLFYYKKELEKSKSVTESILYILAHDLKSPLIAFNHSIQRIIKQITKADYDAATSTLNLMKFSGFNSIHLIDNIMSVYNEKKEDKDEVDIHRFLDDQLQHFQLVAETKNIQIVNAIPTGLSINIYKNALAEIVRNLVDNAIKHASCSIIQINLNQTLDKTYEFQVLDNGPLQDETKILRMINYLNESESKWELSKNQMGTRIIKRGLSVLKSNLSYKRENGWTILSFGYKNI